VKCAVHPHRRFVAFSDPEVHRHLRIGRRSGSIPWGKARPTPAAKPRARPPPEVVERILSAYRRSVQRHRRVSVVKRATEASADFTCQKAARRWQRRWGASILLPSFPSRRPATWRDMTKAPCSRGLRTYIHTYIHGRGGFEPATSRVKRGRDAADLADLQGKAGRRAGCSIASTRYLPDSARSLGQRCPKPRVSSAPSREAGSSVGWGHGLDGVSPDARGPYGIARDIDVAPGGPRA
jgi:hypothetical protein